MLTPTKKAAGGLKTTTATATHNATDFIATEAFQEGTTGSFHAEPCAGIDRWQYRAVRHRDRIPSGAEHTTEYAGNLPDSEVFSRLEFKDALSFGRIYGFGAGSVYPQGRQHGVFHVFKPSSTRYRLNTVASGFQSQYGAKAMTTVNTITTSKTAPLGNTPATIPSIIGRQQAIENALTTALYFIRLPATDSGLRAATGRAIRATAMLKQACAEISNGERV